MTMPDTELPLDIRIMTLATQVLVTVFVVLGLGVAGAWLAHHPVWAVKGLTVDGEVSHQSAVTLRAQLASQMRSVLAPGALALDLQRVREMFESMPWVRHAVVRREFPNRLRVTLQEHEAVAWWGPSGSNRLLSRLGEVFEATPDDGEGLPELVGPDDQAPLVWNTYLQLQEVFGQLDMGVQTLALNERGSWRAGLDNGARIELGRGSTEELRERVNRFARTLGQLTQHYPGALESVDLRYPNGYALRVRGVTTLEETLPTKNTQR